MTERKSPRVPRKSDVSIVRSSAAEYLTFVAVTGKAQSSVEMRYEDENLWLTQKMMATLYDVSVPAVSQHLKRIYADNELEREATVKQFLMVQTEGECEVQRKVDHYSLQAIIAVGFKIENERGPIAPRARDQDRCAHHRLCRHRPPSAAAAVGQAAAWLSGNGVSAGLG